jgi:hypothetical protein
MQTFLQPSAIGRARRLMRTTTVERRQRRMPDPRGFPRTAKTLHAKRPRSPGLLIVEPLSRISSVVLVRRFRCRVNGYTGRQSNEDANGVLPDARVVREEEQSVERRPVRYRPLACTLVVVFYQSHILAQVQYKESSVMHQMHRTARI